MDKAQATIFKGWLSEFLWHWTESELLTGEAADGITALLEQQLASDAKTGSRPYPEPLAYLRALEIRGRQK